MLKTKIYLHSSKESNYKLGKSLGLRGLALNRFTYALYQVEFDVIVDEKTGEVEIDKVDGFELKKT